MDDVDRYPHFNFDFQRIREYWTAKLASHTEAEEYLNVVQRRLEYWLAGCGSWIDFDFALRHLKEDLHVKDVESRLTWLALRRRARLGNEQRRRLSPGHRQREAEEVSVEVKVSEDGKHDAVWHEDFRDLYNTAIAKELKVLKRLRETGVTPVAATRQKSPEGEGNPRDGRSRLQWMWANRLLAYLFESLRESEAICDDGGMWAALDGVFTDRQGNAITRKDLALWAHQYHNNKSCGDELGKPKKHGMIDEKIERIRGK
jgi:hypothetical protein